MMRPRSASLLLFGLCLGACSDDNWRTRNIEGRLPPLELRLSRSLPPLAQADFAGRVTVVAFGFLSCPDICPTNLAKLAEAKRRLPPRLAGKLQVVFVSVDPARDTPTELSAYVRHFDGSMLGATGTPAELRALVRRYRSTFSYGVADADGNYEVSHPAGIYVFDSAGRARLLFQSDDPVEAMHADLARLLAEGSESAGIAVHSAAHSPEGSSMVYR